jgi:hypothetical protein
MPKHNFCMEGQNFVKYQKENIFHYMFGQGWMFGHRMFYLIEIQDFSIIGIGPW